MSERPAPWPHPEIPQDGLIYSWDEDCQNMRTFARIDVSGLTDMQIAAVRTYAHLLPRKAKQ